HVVDSRISCQRGCGLVRDLAESDLVGDGEVGEHFAINVDRGLAEPIHQHAVAHAQLAGRGVDAGDPKRAKFALLVPAVAILILARLHHRFLGDAIDVVSAAAITLGLGEYLLVPRLGGYTTLDSWHGCPLCVEPHRFHAVDTG